MYTCSFCQKEFKNKGGQGAHVPYCRSNPDRKQRPKSPNAHPKKGNIPWNKGLTKETSTSLDKASKTLKDGYTSGRLVPNRTPHSESTKKTLSDYAKKRKLGGYIRGSGRGHKGWFKGYFCDSSWELAFVIYNIDHKISFERNTKFFHYTFEGSCRRFLPDFVVNGRYVEIKGYVSEQFKAKLKDFPDEIDVLTKQEMSHIIDYVVGKYGRNFIELYDGRSTV